jgi:hypothetical protein
VRDADGQRLAAHRAASAAGEGLHRVEAHAAGAVAIQVVLAFLREEFDGADVAVAGLQRPAHGEEVRRAGEARRLAAELGRRMSV